MKRSKMIERMVDSWLGYFTEVDDIDRAFVQENMVLLLGQMEEAGMLPPYVEAKPFEVRLSGYVWEPETNQDEVSKCQSKK
jgi:hypothetical protein